MGLSVKYNDIELNKYLSVLKGFTPFVGAEWNPEVSSAVETNCGADFLYTKYGSKILEMPFEISGNLEEKCDALQKILNVNEPKPLIFGNLPQKMFYAVPTGTLDFEEIAMFGTGTITWLIPDGLAHATTKKPYEAHRNNGVYELEIDNQGTVAAPIDFEITNNHENGYVGIVSEHGIIQIGRADETDEESYEKSQLLIDDKANAILGWQSNNAILTTVTNPHTQSGAGELKDGYVQAQNYGTGSHWHGPSFTKKVPADRNEHYGAKNCTMSWHHYFSTSTINNLGVAQFLMTDKNRKNVAGVAYYKNSTGTNFAKIYLYVNGKIVKELEMECSYNNPITGQQAGMASISKYGERFEFSVGGKTYPFNAPEMKDIEVSEISVYFGEYSNNEAVGANLAYFVRFMSHSVEAWRDVPNRYKAGTVIKVDGHSGKIYVDGVASMGDEVKGTKYFLAPPGKTKIQFGYSDFSNPPPTFKAYIREAYL
ncbi:phage tail family protein [Faecalicatena sp. Marseille-Q4148]|nr:phage tail family protein [Faecalicatena sp. Marseille-Q4148]